MESIMKPQDCQKEATAQVPLANMQSIINPQESQEEATAQGGSAALSNFVYLQQHQLVICREHGYAVGIDLKRHMKDHHPRYTPFVRKAVFARFQNLSRINPQKAVLPRANNSPIEGLLPPQKAFQCIGAECGYISSARDGIMTHSRKVHHWKHSKETPTHWTELFAQSFSQTPGKQRWFAVSVEEGHTTAVAAPVSAADMEEIKSKAVVLENAGISSYESPAMDPLYPFVKLSEYPLFICKLCRFACVANEVQTHLRRHHRDMDKGAGRIAILEVKEIPGIIRSQEELRHFQLPEFVEKPIPSITRSKTDGLRCDTCPFIARDRQSLQQHCRTEHGWANDRKRIDNFKNGPLEDLPASWTKNVHCQRFSPTRAVNGWFQVRQSSTESLEPEQQVQFDDWMEQSHESQEQRFNMGPESQLKWSEQEESQPGDLWDLVDVAIHHMKHRASIAGNEARYTKLSSASFRAEMGKWLEERCGTGEESIGSRHTIGETDIDVGPVASGSCFAALRSRGDRRRIALSSTGTGGGEEDWCEPSVDETNPGLVFDNAIPIAKSAMAISSTAGFRRTQREAPDGQRPAQPPFTPKSSSQGPEVPQSGQRVTIKTRSSATLAAEISPGDWSYETHGCTQTKRK
ncbi:hypothetical protein E4U57_006399 [Claviceps arundinis]|uniref:C2H2-type domain-containing protein n=1 Tax=Claviceps arundinis TaxID=1623583 RepID=A0ABQ7P1Z3_9HYPO|nr:hypothetical protein E4U57_006399 [Claviceps arundinis]